MSDKSTVTVSVDTVPFNLSAVRAKSIRLIDGTLVVETEHETITIRQKGRDRELPFHIVDEEWFRPDSAKKPDAESAPEPVDANFNVDRRGVWAMRNDTFVDVTSLAGSKGDNLIRGKYRKHPSGAVYWDVRGCWHGIHSRGQTPWDIVAFIRPFGPGDKEYNPDLDPKSEPTEEQADGDTPATMTYWHPKFGPIAIQSDIDYDPKVDREQDEPTDRDLRADKFAGTKYTAMMMDLAKGKTPGLMEWLTHAAIGPREAPDVSQPPRWMQEHAMLHEAGNDDTPTITTDPGIRSGKPRIAGTRITVEDVLRFFASGMDRDEVRSGYQDVTFEQIDACFAYAADMLRDGAGKGVEAEKAEAKGHAPDAGGMVEPSEVYVIERRSHRSNRWNIHEMRGCFEAAEWDRVQLAAGSEMFSYRVRRYIAAPAPEGE